VAHITRLAVTLVHLKEHSLKSTFFDKEEMLQIRKTRNLAQLSADGFVFDKIEESVLSGLKFSRSYWGAENVAAWIFEQNGYKVMNLCPWFAPVHVHKAPRTDGLRPRINSGDSSAYAFTGDLIKYCFPYN